MNNTVFYIVVAVVIIHFVIGVVFLVRKLSGPLPEEDNTEEDNSGLIPNAEDLENKPTA
jgi:cell division protein FtsN